MKKIILLVVFLFSSFIFTNSFVSTAEDSEMNSDIIARNRILELEKEMYVKNLIQYIEFESEVIIPEYIEFEYVEYIYLISDTLGVPTRTAFRLVYKESAFRDTVVSPVGAEGLMQLMPDTRRIYKEILRTDTLNLDKNREDIYIGLNMLKDLHSFWLERGNSDKYSWKLSLASYNAGKGNVIKYQGIPPFKETQDFVNFIYKAHSNPQFFANYAKKYENEIKNRT